MSVLVVVIKLSADPVLQNDRIHFLFGFGQLGNSIRWVDQLITVKFQEDWAEIQKLKKWLCK